MHSRMPRLMLAQRGSGCPQSQHCSFPGMLCTLCRMVSPFPPRSRESVAESMLLVEGEAVLSSLCREKPKIRILTPVTQLERSNPGLGEEGNREFWIFPRILPHLDVVAVGALPVGRGNAGLDSLDPGLAQLL